MKHIRVILFISILWNVTCLKAQEYKIEQQIIDDFRDSEKQQVFVWLNDYVDIDNLRRNSKYNRKETTKEMLSLLNDKAKASQQSLQNRIADELGDVEVKWTYITNGFYILANLEMVQKISLWPEVKGIYPERKAVVNFNKSESKPPYEYIQPGLKAINAHKLWELGYTGYGTKAYVYDSGEEYEHPALKSKFYGNIKGFKNAWSGGSDRPFDVGGHGTHVTGTICGIDVLKRDTLGVAFNASWMGGPTQFRNSPDQPHFVRTKIENYQYALNPDGDINTIDDMPDVINNSWGDTIKIYCNTQDPFTEVFKALELAGVAIVWSAGNDGPGPNTVTYYHGLNYSLVSGFSVGATNVNYPHTIADFSSRGPSDCIVSDPLSSLSIKPEVSAPGVSIRSSYLNGGYQVLNGTSMAAPHVSGAVLLLKEAFPYLSGEELLFALYSTAIDLGNPGEDNTYGNGFIDVYAAYLYLSSNGNIPVPPLSNKSDIVVLDLIEYNAQPYCKDDHLFSTMVYNNGKDTILNFTLYITSNNNNIIHFDTLEWQGSLLPADSTSIALPLQNFHLAGPSSIKTELVLPAEYNEERTLNNVWLREFEVKDRTYPMITIDAPQKVCVGSNVLLKATVNETDPLIPAWYDNANSPSPIGYGNEFLFGPVYQNTSIYTEPLLKKELNITYDELNHKTTALKNVGLIFDVKKEIYLESVTVFIAKEGVHVFTLVNEKSKIVKSVSGNFKSGKQLLKFDVLVQPENNYKLNMAIVKEVGINDQNVNYPIEIEDIINIKSAFGFNEMENNSVFPVFFDWKISLPYACGREEYKILVNEADTVSEAVLMIPDSIDLSKENSLLVRSSIVDTGFTYNWSFTNNPTSNEPSFIVVFDSTGIFTCSLMLIDSSGCSNFMTKNIVVYDDNTVNTSATIINSKFSIVPNPAYNNIIINSKEGFVTATVNIIDVSGRIIRSVYNYTVGDQINIMDMEKGYYFVKIKDDTSTQCLKFLKL